MRDSHTANIIEDKIWIFGGSNNETIFNDLWTYDIQLSEWKEET